MSLLAHAYLRRLTPIFQGKRSGNRNRKAPFRGKLGELGGMVLRGKVLYLT